MHHDSFHTKAIEFFIFYFLFKKKKKKKEKENGSSFLKGLRWSSGVVSESKKERNGRRKSEVVGSSDGTIADNWKEPRHPHGCSPISQRL